MVERTVVERTVVERTVVETTSGGKHLSRGTELAPNFVSIGFAEVPSNFISGRFLRLGML